MLTIFLIFLVNFLRYRTLLLFSVKMATLLSKADLLAIVCPPADDTSVSSCGEGTAQAPKPKECHPTLTLLKQGCRSVEVAECVAEELLKYLWLRTQTVLATSTSSQMEQVWQWCLINTRVINEVYKLLGMFPSVLLQVPLI